MIYHLTPSNFPGLFLGRIRRRVYLTAVFLFVVVLSGCEKLPYTNLDNDGLDAMLKDNVPIFDIRRVEEWKQTGIVAGSQLLTFVDKQGRLNQDFLQQFVADVGPNDPVILICRTGNRTATLARLLTEQLGYTQVYNVRDGITRWKQDNRPVRRL